jgi:NADH-quinone oxidoreductase subunit J
VLHVVLFGITVVLALGGGVGVIAARQPVHSALGLLVVLLSLAVDYLLLDAQFIAALQVIIYAGAFVVLFVFIIMLLHARSGEGPGPGAGVPRAGAIVLCVLFGVGLLFVVSGARAAVSVVGPGFGTIQDVGQALFSRYLLPFEAASLVLLTGMIGAVALGRRLPERPAHPPEPRTRGADAPRAEASR